MRSGLGVGLSSWASVALGLSIVQLGQFDAMIDPDSPHFILAAPASGGHLVDHTAGSELDYE